VTPDLTLIPSGAYVLAAVSGGPDSLAMLHSLAAARDGGGFRLGAVHVHHGQRPEADDDAAAVEQHCREWGVRCRVVRCDVPRRARERRLSLELAGREARYEAFREVALSEGYDHVATAHTADDQAETVLMRLLRGCSPDGLAGIPRRRPLAPGSPITVIRPLLHVTRADVEAYCGRHGLHPLADPANADPRYLRNRLRHQVLPLLEAESPGVRAHLVRVSRDLAADAELLRGLAAASLAAAAAPPEGLDLPWVRRRGVQVLQLERLTGILALRPRVLVLQLQATPAASGVELDAELIRRGMDLLLRGHGTVEIAGAPLRWRAAHGTLTLEPTEPEPLPPVVPVSPGSTPAPAWGVRVEVGAPGAAEGALAVTLPGRHGPLFLRPPAPGERLERADRGPALVADLFARRRIPRLLRRTWPVLADDRGPLWLPGIAVAARTGGEPALEVALTPATPE
jgi:tRNA(Ile)-lysidine synthase